MPLYKAGIIEYTWETKPSVAPLGQIICVTDIGENGSLWRGNGTKWIKLNAFVLYSNLATTSLTGTTTETTLATISIKGGVLGENGKLRFYIAGTVTNSANNKVFRLRHSSAIIWQLGLTTAVGVAAQVLFLNKNSESSQTNSLTNSHGLSGASFTLVTTSSIDTSADFSLTFTGQLANSADTITLESLFVEIVQ